MATKPSRFGAQWVMLAITILLFVLVALFVDLKPVVDENFFFSTSDPGVQQSKKVEQRFPSQPQLILAVSYPIFRQHNGSVWPSSPAVLSTFWQTSSSCRYWEVLNGKGSN
jgi:hypothetical protein